MVYIMKTTKLLWVFSLLCIGLITWCSTTQQSIVDISSTSGKVVLPIVENSTVPQDTPDNNDYIVDTTNTENILITFDESIITTTDPSIRIEDTTLTITQSWNYELQWVLNDWQVLVDTNDEQAVTLIMNNVSLTNNIWSPLVVQSADQTVIVLTKGTVNSLADGNTYSGENDEDINAVLYSRDDLIIQWEWALEINANYNDWISWNDDVIVRSGSITINAVDDGIRWNDSLLIESWIFVINAGWDAIQTENIEEWTIQIQDWDFTLIAWDDAIHSETSLVIDDWVFTILEAFEWIEAQDITINWWEYIITSTDDGFNAGWAWDDNKEKWSAYRLTINGWEIFVTSEEWDSIDSNGIIEINWWRLIVIGAQRWWTSFDFVDDIIITWWEILATWNGWREQPWSNASTQNSLFVTLETPWNSNGSLRIEDSNGNKILSYIPEKWYKYFIVSHPQFNAWDTYTYFIDNIEIGQSILIEGVTRIWG